MYRSEVCCPSIAHVKKGAIVRPNTKQKILQQRRIIVIVPETPEVRPKIYNSLNAGEVRFTWCVFRVSGFSV